MSRFTRARAILRAEFADVRERDADLDPGEFTAFTLPLLGRAMVLTMLGVVPLVVIRMGDDADEVFIPTIASFALAAVCSAVIAWIAAAVISAFATVVVYRKPPRAASGLVSRTMGESFRRINDATSTLMLLALVVGLVALGFGMPARRNGSGENSVVDDLLAAQVALLLAGLAVAFVAEACRVAADIMDDQSLALAWPWALLIVTISWVLATVAGPLEFTTMVRRLLADWLPETVGDASRQQAIDDVMPGGARWAASFGVVPILIVIWFVQARINNGFAVLREAPRAGR